MVALLRPCSVCGVEVAGQLWKGKCNPCYKRLDWRPAGGRGVERERDYNHWNPGSGRPEAPRGYRPRKYAKCGRCARFKSRPSSACGSCGDEPLTHGGDPYEYDRAAGWD